MTNVFVKTYGCSHNQADSETMQGVLQKEGHMLTDEADAQVIVVNSCVVKNQTQKELFRYIEEQKANGKNVVIAGCAPKSIPEKLKEFSQVGTEQLQQIAVTVEKAEQGQTHVALEEQDTRYTLPKVRKNAVVEILPINQGCLGSCTYCLTVHARGKLKSYELREIKHAAQAAIKDGVKEIWLTSQDTACWGIDMQSRLPQLVQALTEIEGDFKIRIGMGNPNWFILTLDDLIPVLKHPKVFKFLHIPVQAGNDRVLHEMKRGYTQETYRTCIQKLKEAIPELTIATDVICGFPTETEEEFQDTLTLIKDTKPEVLNISKYAARPHTPAASMQQVPGDQVKTRTKRLQELHNNIRADALKKWVGSQATITLTERGNRENQWVGRNGSYVPVIVEGNYTLGQTLHVTITRSHQHHLEAQPLDTN